MEAASKVADMKKRRRALNLFDEEAHEGSEGEEENPKKKSVSIEAVDDDDVEEEDEGESNNYVADDFLEDDLTGRAATDVKVLRKSKQKPVRTFKKLKKKKDSIILDEEDYRIVEENKNAAISHGNVAEEAVDDDNNDEDEDLQGDEDINENDLVGEKSAPPPRLRGYEDQDDDEMADFIDDEDEDGGEDGLAPDGERGPAKQRVKQPRKQQQRRPGQERDAGPTYDQVQEVFDIFGQGFDEFDDDDDDLAPEEPADEAELLDGEGEGDLEKGDGDGDGEEGEDAEVAQRRRRAAALERRSVSKLKSKFEYSQLVSSFCTDKDEVLRQLDRPERLQQLLPRSSAPDAVERRREAAWLATLLAAKMELDRQLDSARTAEVLARIASSRRKGGPHGYGNGSNGSSSHSLLRAEAPFNMDLLRQALLEPVEHVLRFLQEEHLEVPFIWSYRRDYLHPEMKRAHVWFVLEQDEKWEALHAARLKTNREMQALCDAAAGGLHDAAMLRAASLEVASLRESCELLRAEVMEAEDRERRAMDLLEAKDAAGTLADRNRVREASEQLLAARQQHESADSQRLQAINELRKLRERLRRKERFDEAAAAEVLRLCPPDRYQPLLEASDDEQQVRYISAFLTLLSRGADKDKDKDTDPGAAAKPERPGSQPADEDEEAGPALETDPAEEGPGLAEEEEVVRGGMQGRRRPVAAAGVRRLGLGRGRDEYSRLKSMRAVRALCEHAAALVCDIGDALRFGYRVRPPSPPAVSVEETAGRLLHDLGLGQVRAGASLSQRQLIEGALTVLATELAHEPTIRSRARALYLDRARVTTRPTEKGVQCIGPFSALFGLHRLQNKPLREFFFPPPSSSSSSSSSSYNAAAAAQSRAHNSYGAAGVGGVPGLCIMRTGEQGRSLFLRLVEAERLGLLTISVDLPDPDQTFAVKIGLFDQLLPELDPAASEARQSWDSFRLEVVRRSVDLTLLPSLQTELRRDLVRLGREAVIEEAALNFETMLRVGPYRRPNLDRREKVKELLLASPRIPGGQHSVVCIYISQDRGQSMHMVYLNKDGVLQAHDTVPEQAVKSQKPSRIKSFLLLHRPDLVVLNASGGFASRGTLTLLEKSLLAEVQAELLLQAELQRADRRGAGAVQDDDDEDQNDDELPHYHADVLLIDDQLAKIFQSSPRSKQLCPDLPAGAAAAVSLGRFSQEPLAEFCSLWSCADSTETFGFEAFFLDLHPLKSLVRGMKGALLRALEAKLVDAVCEVGVDVNRAASHDHLGAMLAFVAGLGLRKADALRQTIRRNIGQVDSRNTLLVKKLMGPVVWTNAAGFLRVAGSSHPESSGGAGFAGAAALDDMQSLEYPLDNTRIHPECYITHDFAPKICYDAQDAKNVVKPSEIVLRFMRSLRREWEKRLRKYDRWLDLWMGDAALDRAAAEAGPDPGPGPGLGPWFFGVPDLVRPPPDVEFTERIKDAQGTVHELGFELDDPLSRLQLGEYAAELEAQGFGKRFQQICQIKDELRFPWLDLRDPLRSLDNTSHFSVLTGESDSSLYVGLQIGCVVEELNDVSYFDRQSNDYRRRQRASVRTDLGLRGSISVMDVSDDRIDPDSFNLSEVLHVGKRIAAVVIAVKKDRMTLDLTIKPSLLQAGESWWLQKRCSDSFARAWWETVRGRDPNLLFDAHFDEAEAVSQLRDLELQQSRVGSDKAGASHLALPNLAQLGVTDRPGMGSAGPGGSRGPKEGQAVRMVTHPLFANLDFKSTEERLRREGGGAGAVLIRPSSKGTDHLTITWAFQDRWFKHIPVLEAGKRPGDIGLGGQLFVEEDDMRQDPFSDLDEIHSRYIEPLNDYVSAMVNHRSFMAGSPEEVEAAMRQQLRDRPDRVPYFIRFDPSLPGFFVLTWMSINPLSQTPVKTDRIAVRPYGYKIRGETFARPSALIDWFKRITEAAAKAAAESARTAARGRAQTGSVPAPPPPPLPPAQAAPPPPRRPSRFNQAQADSMAADQPPPVPLPPMPPPPPIASHHRR